MTHPIEKQDVIIEPNEISDVFKKSTKAQTTHRPHFRIDWRQLSYYEKPKSRLATWLANPSKSGVSSFQSKNSLNELNHFEPHLQEGVPKCILNSLDGSFRSGQLSAILGPSGAGKSTFLSSLFGSKQETSYGETRVIWLEDKDANGNHNELAINSKEMARRRLRVASLPQHDHLLNHLTVYESLMFASKIKNARRGRKSKGESGSFHRQNVRKVAKMLKLTDCLDTRCSKLSGGQYKRVSIGQELLSEPDVIILDEPTSGLDAMTCLSTVQTLKSIVMGRPIAIVLTIHQPDMEVFSLFDHVYVISQGGMAIYEGSPRGIVDYLGDVGLKMPSQDYNPARFIVENAFVGEDSTSDDDYTGESVSSAPPTSDHEDDDKDSGDSGEEDNEICGDRIELGVRDLGKVSNYVRRSLVSISGAISGKETPSKMGSRKFADEKPLLNIGIEMADGKIITSELLARDRARRRYEERWELLRRLSSIQRSRYHHDNTEDIEGSLRDDFRSEIDRNQRVSESKSDCSSTTGSLGIKTPDRPKNPISLKVHSMANLGVSEHESIKMGSGAGSSLALTGEMPCLDPTGSDGDSMGSSFNETAAARSEPSSRGLTKASFRLTGALSPISTGSDHFHRNSKPSRNFDKRLSSKSCSATAGGDAPRPLWYHTKLLAHRTWLSIVRDPIFFGIQACMHTTIPVLLAVIFGSIQDEGCPRIGSFDLVEFAYEDSSKSLLSANMHSIRLSIGNIGIMFFEMFVLCFAINCITALVFPLDMHVLLKEHRNGWYSLKSYFFARTLADLPIPVVLHSMAMTILTYLTGQPFTAWRFFSILALVVLASLIAQSVGLTIGALLMKSSQSAVLAAAAIVAPFFALSGFIVRIHTLPWVARMFAQASYLYQLLNGFIVLRYGYERCPCKEEDFEADPTHAIPANLRTLASIWVGTFSEEYANSKSIADHVHETGSIPNRTNIDPNIDLVDKMMKAFTRANTYGHDISECSDVLPYAMLDFNLRDQDVWGCAIAMLVMLVIYRIITFSAIYYKVRSFA